MAWSLNVVGVNDGEYAAIDLAEPDPAALLQEELDQVAAAKQALKAALAGMFQGGEYLASCAGAAWGGGGSLNFSLRGMPADQLAALTAAGFKVGPIDVKPPG